MKHKIALIWPWGFDSKRVLPIALGYLASNLNKEKYDVRIFDNSLKDRPSSSLDFQKELIDFSPSIIGISGWAHNIDEITNLINVSREILPSSKIILGGVYATAYAEVAFKDLKPDFLLKGEAEKSFAVFLDEFFKERPNFKIVPGLFYKNQINITVQVPPDSIEELDELAPPDYDAIDLTTYHDNGYRYKSPMIKSAPIWVTRGCPYRCTFCAAPMINGKVIRAQSVEYMVKHIKDLYYKRGIKWFNIIDDNFTLHKNYAKKFCREIIKLNLPIKFSTPNGIRMQKGDSELWNLMREAGWSFLVVAPESGSKKTLEIMKKDLKLEILPGILNEIRNAKLKIHAFFIVGYPGENLSDLKKTRKLILESKIDFPVIGYFQPIPGTPIYDDLISKGEIVPNEQLHDACSGKMKYKTPELKNINLPLYVLTTYLLLCLKRPRIIFHVLNLYGVHLIFRELGSQFLTGLGLKKATGGSKF